MDKKTIKIIGWVALALVVIYFLRRWYKNDTVPFWSGPYNRTSQGSTERARCVKYGGGKTCCGSLKFNNLINEYECFGESN